MSMEPAEGLDEYGRSAVHYAALKGDAGLMRDLLAQGMDPGLQDASGMTPLHFAAQEWRKDVAESLLAHGALVDVQSHVGNTPLFDAVYNSRGRAELIELLREAGADPLRENANGQSPFSLAKLIGNFDVAQYFGDLNG